MLEFLNHINFTIPMGFAMTYLLHSTLWILLVTILVRTSYFNSISIKNHLWKAALIGGLSTSLFASFFAQDFWKIPVIEDLTTEISTDENSTSSPTFSTDKTEINSPTNINQPTTEISNNTNTDLTSEKYKAWTWATLFSSTLKYCFLFWIIGSVFLWLKLSIRHWVFFRKINPRRTITDQKTLSIFQKIQTKADLQSTILLSTTPKLDSPILIKGKEICLPSKAVEHLEDIQLEGMIAHELAHIARKDHYWTLGIVLLDILFFFQPLHRIAMKEIKKTNELLCDNWAANLTGNNLALAKCLLTVAEWMKNRPINHPLVAGMSVKKSDLSNRVQSLINLPDIKKQRYDAAKSGFLVVGFLLFCFIILPAFTFDTTQNNLTALPIEKQRCKLLLDAVKANDVAKVKELVRSIDPNCSYCIDGFPSSPFNAAAFNGYTEIGNILLENNVDLFYTAMHEGSASIYAAQNGHIDFMKLIQNKGGSLNFQQYEYGSPLTIAIQHAQKEMVDYLLKSGADPLLELYDNKSPLFYAEKKGGEILQIFLKHKKEI